MSFPSYRCAPYSHESRQWSDSGADATISDKRRSVCNEELGIAYFEAEVLTQTDYYPFGMMMPDWQWSAGAEGYRYGFNGMERDDETYGKGNALDFGARIYDSRLGRWLKQDFYFRAYPSQSAFNFGLNWPINILDIDGNTIVPMRYIFFFRKTKKRMPLLSLTCTNLGLSCRSRMNNWGCGRPVIRKILLL